MDKYVVNMKDGDTKNCRVENLEWCAVDTNYFRNDESEDQKTEKE